MHRDYTVIGSEVHVDMYDDRLEIYSPGGMLDGTLIQKRDIYKVPSKRRNPVIAEIFHRLDFIERRGSGLKKIRDATASLYGYTDDFVPEFRSTATEFHVILKNMNYDLRTDLVGDLVGAPQDALQDRIQQLLDFCTIPRTRDEMQRFMGLADRGHFRESILRPLLETGRLRMTIPDKPNSRNQRYIRTSNHSEDAGK
jgi:ATP-dependent DNA helicase RecG